MTNSFRGGTGKTTLTLAFCHYDETIATFDDGILWLTLGKNPNVLEGLTKIYAALAGERPGFVDQEDAAFYLSEKLEGKFEQEPLVEASIRHTLGNTYRNIGEFEKAQMHLELAETIRLDQLGEAHADTLSTIDGLARVYWRQGQ